MGRGLGTGSWRLRNCLTGQGRGWEDSPLGRRRTALPPAWWGDRWPGPCEATAGGGPCPALLGRWAWPRDSCQEGLVEGRRVRGPGSASSSCSEVAQGLGSPRSRGGTRAGHTESPPVRLSWATQLEPALTAAPKGLGWCFGAHPPSRGCCIPSEAAMGLVPPADQGDGAPESALTRPVGGQRGWDPGLDSPGTFHHIPPSLAGESLQTCGGRGVGGMITFPMPRPGGTGASNRLPWSPVSPPVSER